MSPLEVIYNEEMKTDEFPNEIEENNDIKNTINQYHF